MSITKLTTNGIVGAKYDTVSADNYYMEPIATTLLASAATSITFSNIPQGYKHLQIRGIGRWSTGTEASVFLQFNGDTGSNYARHELGGTGSGAYASAAASQTSTTVGYIRSGTSIFGASVIDVLDYSNVYKYKTLRSLTGCDANGAGYIILFSGLWMNTAPVTSITMFVSSNQLAADTRFSLYGIRG
jgi:hypothetical protein